MSFLIFAVWGADAELSAAAVALMSAAASNNTQRPEGACAAFLLVPIEGHSM